MRMGLSGSGPSGELKTKDERDCVGMSIDHLDFQGILFAKRLGPVVN